MLVRHGRRAGCIGVEVIVWQWIMVVRRILVGWWPIVERRHRWTGLFRIACPGEVKICSVKRRLFNVLVGVSLVLFVATMVMWVRSYNGPTDLLTSQHAIVESWQGRLSLLRSPPPAPHGYVALDPIENNAPYWTVALIFALIPCLWIFLHLWHPARKHGVCPACGYDLRATPERCPECGTVPQKTI